MDDIILKQEFYHRRLQWMLEIQKACGIKTYVSEMPAMLFWINAEAEIEFIRFSLWRPDIDRRLMRIFFNTGFFELDSNYLMRRHSIPDNRIHGKDKRRVITWNMELTLLDYEIEQAYDWFGKIVVLRTVGKDINILPPFKMAELSKRAGQLLPRAGWSDAALQAYTASH